MPEGDTVWQTARRLDRLAGHRLKSSDLRVPELATRDLAGAVVLETATRGKHLLTRLDTGLTLHSHLGMSGRWDVQPAGTRWRRPAGTRWRRPAYQARVVLATDAVGVLGHARQQPEATEAVGYDVRLRLVPTSEEATLVGHLGPDLLGDDWDAAEACRRLAGVPDRSVYESLLDQRNLAGIGNVYANELCFIIGLDPRRPVADADRDRLVERAHTLLVANRDRPVRVTTGDPRRGRQTWVYGRRGPCLRCSTPIRHARLGVPGRERSVWWCPHCQPPR